MSDLTDKLTELLGNDESRKKLFETASMLGLGGAQADEGGEDSGQKPAVPDILNMFTQPSGNISSKKLNLLKAFEPYFSDSRAALAERAVKIAGIAASVKDALKYLER